MNKDYKNRKYTVVPYNPRWKRLFEKEARIISSVFGEVTLAIEHVGSTSVPGMASKPTIDILVLTDSLSAVENLNKEMEAAGYAPLGKYISPDMRFFAKEDDNTRLCNVHVAQYGNARAVGMLKLRDYFIDHPQVASDYSRLKLRLAAEYPDDYGQYRKYKDEWMENLKSKLKING